MRLARAEALAGKQETSLAALQRAATLLPESFPQQEAYARGLIEAGRVAEAYTQYQKILNRWPRNADALVNYGLLAQRQGHVEEAVDSWQRAVDVDPRQTNAQINLAQALDARGEAQAAARHYRAYLQIVAAHQDEHRGEAATGIAALIKVADADGAANQQTEAMKGYDDAIKFAERASTQALQTLALVHLADLQEKRGDAAAAAAEYQRALAIDASLSDPVSTASDWFNYAQFLRRQHQPERLVFACLLHAEGLVNTTPGAELSAIVQAREGSEARLGREAVVVRRSSTAIEKLARELSASSFSPAR
jgi:tetratricopeptide (TPR) repeat protein